MAEQAKGQTDDITTETLENEDKKSLESAKDHDERVRATNSVFGVFTSFDGCFLNSFRQLCANYFNRIQMIHSVMLQSRLRPPQGI